MLHDRVHACGLAAILCLAVALGGCNAAGPGPSSEVVAAAPSAPPRRLPPGASCSASINNYHDVTKSDLETGNLNQSVYDEINKELDRASAACAAGREGEARSIIASSKERHGYHNY